MGKDSLPELNGLKRTHPSNSMWCALFGDQGIVVQTDAVAMSVPQTQSCCSVPKPPSVTFTLSTQEEIASSQGQFFVFGDAINLANVHRLALAVDGGTIGEVAFTTTPQTIAHGQCPLTSGSVYWTRFAHSPSVGYINTFSFSMLHDSSFLVTVSYVVGGVSGERTFHVTSSSK